MDVSKYKELYLQESAGHITGIEEGLLALEKDFSDAATIDRLFRHYHSLKGMSASMGYEPIKKIAHAQENLLSNIRSNKTVATKDLVSTLLTSLDRIKELMLCVEEDLPLQSVGEAGAEVAREESGGKTGVAAEPRRPAAGGELRLPSTMKVNSSVFDGLLSTAGELFMTLGSFKALSQTLRVMELKEEVHVFGKTLDKLHGEILAARMLPIEDLTGGLPRVVRDMSVKSGKSVELKIEGGGISVDRAILEDLGSPLVHIIRNAVDHGIETPEERKSLGKPASGTIRVSAYEKRHRVAVEVSDDGRGIDVEQVRIKAVKEGLAPSVAMAMSPRDILMLVCSPGLTTAEKITDTSGRGVGMNVVKDVVEGHGGSLFIDSQPGKGTTVAMELPRTTSIIKALLIESGSEQFLVPISMIERVVEMEASAGPASHLRYEDTDVPLIDLAELLGIEKPGGTGPAAAIIVESRNGTSGPVGHGAEGAKRVLTGITVDEFGMEIEAYIKALTPPLSKLWGVSGVTIMGDGRPVFVIDIPQVISKARQTQGD